MKTEQEFAELADIILTLKDKASIIRELETLYRFGTDDGYDQGYDKGHRDGYEECLDRHNLNKYD
jgi:flagellar biosynthesis/type III secretory pathway protein FliH